MFVGSEGETWNMDPDLLEKAILDRKEKTGKYPKAIVPVALYGMPYRIDEIMWYATQARDAYPYYQHTAIGYNYRMSNVCAGIGRGQMKVLDAHIAHHKHVQALRVFMLGKKIEARPTWKPMHKQPVYAGAPVYTNGIEEELFKVGFCLPAGPYVSDDDVRYIVDTIKANIL